MVRRKNRRPKGPICLDASEIERMREAGRFAARLLDLVEAAIRPGVSTEAIDRLVDETTRERGGVSAPFGYPPGDAHPFPKHCCTSVNHVVCHGIPDPNHILQVGDIVNVDVTPRIDGFHGDTSRTFLVGEVDAEARRLVEDTFEAMRGGIAACRPGATAGDMMEGTSAMEQRGRQVEPGSREIGIFQATAKLLAGPAAPN
ncbi:MAG: M24 family metallopeptidase, partial [Planctomycetota bacterium]